MKIMRFKARFSMIAVVFVFFILPLTAMGEVPVPWDSEDYHAHGYASYWNSTSTGGCPPDSGSDSADAFSPPLQLPIDASANVSFCPGTPGPPWGPGTGQEADGISTISTSEMVIGTYAWDILGWYDIDTDVGANALDKFAGSFNATLPMFEFSYSYVYGILADCCGLDYPLYAGSAVRGWLKVTDLTDSVILLDKSFLDVGVGCYADVSDSGSGVITVPVTVGHDINVEFGIDGYSSAHGSYSMGNSYLTLQYETALTGELVPNIKANGSDGPVTVTQSDPLSVTVELNAAGNSDDADWWVLADTPFGWYRYDVGGDTWVPGQAVTHQGPLFDLSSYEVLNMSGLPVGSYIFYFGVDTIMNGSIDMGVIYYDSVDVNITP
jgi:hypothetical protein